MAQPRKTFQAGDFGEAFVIRELAKIGISAVKNPAREHADMLRYDLDCKLDGVDFTVEVKFDKMEKKTGNVAIEHYNVRKGSPSGIRATTADLWVIVLQEPLTAWVCRTSLLREWFNTQPCLREIACGGDDNAAMKLYNRHSLFDAIFCRLDGCKRATIQDLLASEHLARQSKAA